jgi:hypothetical protein
LVALKYEDVPNVLPPAFQKLANSAMEDLVDSPDVQKAVNEMPKYMNSDAQLNGLIGEAKKPEELPK